MHRLLERGYNVLADKEFNPADDIHLILRDEAAVYEYLAPFVEKQIPGETAVYGVAQGGTRRRLFGDSTAGKLRLVLGKPAVHVRKDAHSL